MATVHTEALRVRGSKMSKLKELVKSIGETAEDAEYDRAGARTRLQQLAGRFLNFRSTASRVENTIRTLASVLKI